jgi:hypothetical protein
VRAPACEARFHESGLSGADIVEQTLICTALGLLERRLAEGDARLQTLTGEAAQDLRDFRRPSDNLESSQLVSAVAAGQLGERVDAKLVAYGEKEASGLSEGPGPSVRLKDLEITWVALKRGEDNDGVIIDEEKPFGSNTRSESRPVAMRRVGYVSSNVNQIALAKIKRVVSDLQERAAR